MKRTAMATGAASLTGLMLLAACGHAGHPDSAHVAAGERPAVASNGAVGAAAAGPAADRSGATGAKAAALLSSPALIRTAALTVVIKAGHSLAAQADRAEQIATDAGGQVYADERSAAPTATATVTLKVPGPSLAAVLARLSALGSEQSRRSSTQDVTTQVVDVGSRVTSARASIDRLRTLYGRAVKVSDVIALESELSQREADLESLQAQQRALAAQTAMATVTLQLRAAAALVHRHHNAGGFLGGLGRGWRAFGSAAGGLATGLGAALPFLLLAGLIGTAAVIVRRRARGGSAPVAAPGDTA